MLCRNTKLATLLLTVGSVLSATLNVDVGGGNALVFNPTTVKANAGDIVRFKFLDLNHTATAGRAGQGCQPSGQFNSGFVPIAQGTNPGSTFDVTVKDENPITVYCAQLQHCQQGMVMVINPTDKKGPASLAAYKTACSKAAKNVAPARVNGGVLRNVQAAKGKGKKAAQAGNGKGKAKGAAQNQDQQQQAKNAKKNGQAKKQANARRSFVSQTGGLPARRLRRAL